MHSTPEPIAIIGAGCRFPGDSTRPSKLWELLKAPRDVASKIPTDRFNVEAFYHPQGTHHGTTSVKESYFLSDRDVRHFDAQFFNTPPTEAGPMDPQHRHLLEVVYEALEDSGRTIEELQGSDTAVFVGLMCNDYSAISSRDFDHIPTYGATGIAASNASSRISYFFDWHGACMTIDTACSSSLIALHQAVQTLRTGASTIAVAAGTNLLLDPLPYVSESNLNMLSPTGRSRMWDADADGYARGDGVAAVILKTLSQAIRDGDIVDCIIRETGANQDGRTKGITMPSGEAQAAMIRDTYQRAGLDPLNPQERCQYFEAHGTGTPAGDPQEASALDAAFFEKGAGDRDPNDVLYVGSVKTVVGHTEGTAGLAGLMKAYMALKHKTIPPNLLFNRLSPAVEPFYKHLRILTEPKPWPDLPAGVPRRASVNSFGFGGSNAHAILESYEMSTSPLPVVDNEEASSGKFSPVGSDESASSDVALLSLIPFVFSANNDSSLAKLLQSYVSYLEENDDTTSKPHLDSLKYTLSCKRSSLAYKAAFTSSSASGLAAQIRAHLEDAATKNTPVGVRSLATPTPSILGVFTGQGAQWAQMGASLIASSPSARRTIEELDASLATLPTEDRPSWSILGELEADAKSSRISEAAISQPLCTAVQVVLVNLLRSAGVKFRAVVGHSSGEIAAAYAAGLIRATDAIRIAYYRGIHAKAASSGSAAKKGAMLAVGTSLADAQEFCELEDFEGRISVAASNSSSSVTLSGDFDAIEEAKAVFDDENKFARLLKVDTAYHSHHMQPCAGPYAASLAACNIQILTPDRDAPTWISSVRGATKMGPTDEDLKSAYWVDNMINTVLFSYAVEHAMETFESFDIGLEVGPHPALKGPATQTVQEKNGKDIPYFGTLARGKNDTDALAAALGSIWNHLGTSGVNWTQFRQSYYAHVPARDTRLLRDLPLYAWDHSRPFWVESRYGRAFRTQDSYVHELLGIRLPDGTSEEMRWKNVLKPKEIEWLSGHALQGQTVFPGTGYIALAMEAAVEVAAHRQKPVRSIELYDLIISKAIAIDESGGTEVVVSITGITEDVADDAEVILAHFTSFSTVSKESTKLAVNASGKLRINIGESAFDVLPHREQLSTEMSDVDIDEFYGAMAELGYGYTGPFRGLCKIRRRLGFASGTINRPTLEPKPLLFHPGMLDSALQTLFAAFSAPGDARLWSLHAPTGIRRVTLVPGLCGANIPEQVDFISTITAVRPNHITGDVDLISADGVNKCIEMDGVGFVPLTAATEADDRALFSKFTWHMDRPDGELAWGGTRATPWEIQKGDDCERAAFFYLRTLNEAVTQEERDAGLEEHHVALLDFATHMQDLVLAGKHPQAKKDWLSDTAEFIRALVDGYGHDADLNILRAVGENMLDVIHGKTTVLEAMTQNGYLDDYYENAMGSVPANAAIAKMVGQIAQRHPHMNILEIGAGTGGATKGILRTLKTAFASYTYTDISTGFFAKARETFVAYLNRMIFKTLDITRDPTTQGYAEHSYDVVIASNVLHATEHLDQTLQNVRRLLKPGGYLVMLEIVYINTMGVGLTMGGLPGWWVGRNNGRRYSPTIPLPQWNTLLKKNGFGGIDTHTPMRDPKPFAAAVFAAQAVDEDVNLLRRPLASRPDQIAIKNLIILGGEGIESSGVVDDLQHLLAPRCDNITVLPTLEDMEGVDVPPYSTIISLLDVDSPVLKDITEIRWASLKRLLADARTVLWVTSGCYCDEPYAGAMMGIHRSVPLELLQMRLQLVELDRLEHSSANILAELLLRAEIVSQWEISPVLKNVLWTLEPEVKLASGKTNFCRVVPDIEANNRYNSAKRLITHELDPKKTAIKLEWIDTGDKYSLNESKIHAPASASAVSPVQVSHSMLRAIRTVVGLAFLSFGVDNTGVNVVSLAGENASQLVMPWGSAGLKDVEQFGTRADLLVLVAAYLYSERIIARIHPGSTVLVHEPDTILASVLRHRLKGKGRRVRFTTSSSETAKQFITDVSSDWIYLHPKSPKRALRKSLPSDVALFFNLSGSSSVDDEAGSLANRITETLPVSCEKADISNLGAKEASLAALHDPESKSKVVDLLSNAVSFAVKEGVEILRNFNMRVDSRSVKDIVDGSVQCGGLVTVVNWEKDEKLPTVLEPVDWRADLFQDGKTYWMVGLAGDLGQSLSDWMIDHGARYIVLTSRKPKVSPTWVESCRAKGATVEYIAGDVTDMDSLRGVHDEIQRRFPPVAGVANGALVLRDKLFISSDFDDLQAILRPKVTGTLNLDHLFEGQTLDWFVAFSSIVATAGNPGQSLYAAANCFMKALINQRRKRGLVGSTIDISRVYGVGYVEREAKRATGRLTEKDMNKIQRVVMPMSEADLHQLFAEAILAGRPDSGRDSDIITGIRTIASTEVNGVYWAANLKFSHFIHDVGHTDGAVEKDGKVSRRIALKTQLQDAKSLDDVSRMVKVSFIAKLSSSLQHSDDHSLSDSTPLIDFGMDSLVAVDVRSWFLQELGVDMPVLKILGGASVADLVQDAVEKLPADFVSKFEAAPVAPATLAADEIAQPQIAESSVTSGAASDMDARTNTPLSSASSSQRSPSPSVKLVGGPELTEVATHTTEDIKSEKLQAPHVFVTTLSYFTPEVVRTEPMSHGQARFWFLRQYLDDPTTSNITFFFKMNGAMDPDRISRTLAMICDRHEALRTCFYVKDGVACQGIMRKSAIRLEQCPVADEHGVRAVYEDLQRHVYDIENGDTFRAVLCQVSPTMLYLVIGYHHIAMDGFSWEILFGELQRGYRAGYLPPVPRQYSTWASKQRQEIDSGQLRSERKFWKQEFSTLPQVLPLLPFAKISSRQPLPCYGLNRTSHKVERRITSLVKEQCRAQKVSPFHFHLAVFRTLLHRFTGADDICIGMADANRMDSADVGVIGFLLNLLPLRFRSTQPNLAFTAMLKEARAKGYAALAHSKVPFNTILEDLDVPRTSSHNPLFQAFIEFRQANKITAAEFETDQPQNSTSYSKTAYDITLNVLEDHAGDLTVSIGTQDTLYTEEATGLILRSYVHLLEAFSKEPALPVDKPSLYSDEDVADAIVLGTGPSLTGVWPETLLHQIEAVARDSVSAAAVKDTLGNSLTYRQLLDRVGTIALALDNVGVTEGSHVAVFQSPSSDWICSMLATMWIGAVYVPLDYRQGLERLAQIAQACSPAAILVDSSTRDEVESLACSSHYINVTKLSDISQATDGSYEAKIKARGDKPAVILFTSGTTGTPKGIVLKHSGLRNGIEGLVSRYDIGREVVLQQTAYSFDMSLDEIFVALCSGGTLVVAGKRLRGDSEAIMRLIALEGVTYTRATPAEYSSWLRHGASHLAGNTSWRFAFAGGDRMTNSLRDEFRALGPLEGLRLFNSYGPTEITLSAVKVEVPYRERDERSDGRPIPIGVSMPNYSIYIVDDNTRLVPVGVPGEIVVGGAGVSFGYLGEAKLTDDRFVENPWAPAHWVQNGWTKMYKTGDRGHMASNGDVHFHGRVAGDTQIKLRGIRLELGDIENNILKASEGVLSNIICTLRRDAGTAESDYIVGHVVFAPGRAVPKTEQSTYFANLLARLALPDYMKPAAMVALERLPLTVHQKIDRAAIATLPVEEILAAEKPSCIEGVDVEFSDLEATIADIWLQVLTKGAPRQLSPSSEFFRLGGNSLLLVETQALIRKTLDVSIPLPDLLEATNLGKMSAKVREAMSLGTIDWDEETTPPEVVHSTMDGIRTPPKTTNLEVVLTGATGHLGRHLMPKLLSDPNISKVHCVAVRNTGKLDPNSQGTDKLVVYPGDITHPRLGLSATDFSHLSASADAIVHCAAVRSFFEPYRVLQKANVCSVAEVVKLAGSRRIPIHYMSSGGVLPDDILSSSAAPRSAAAYVPAANGGEGYVASKWAGERMLERAAAATAAAGHLPVHIYRTLGVVSDDHEAVGRLPASLIDEFARAAVRSNTLLDPEGQWTGSFDLISADEVADAICVRLTTSGDASGDPNAGGEAVDFVHLRATVRVENGQQLSDLLEVPAIRDNIGAFGKLAGPQWIGRLKKAGFGWMVAAQDAVLDGRIRSRR